MLQARPTVVLTTVLTLIPKAVRKCLSWSALLVALITVLTFIPTACDGNETTTTGTTQSDDTAQTSTDPTDTSTDNEASPTPADGTPAREPIRIVSLSPMATELLFAMGAGSEVVAVDEFSYHPPEAPVTNLSGWDPNVEAVLFYEPDLVIVANDANDIVATLDKVDVEVFVSAAPNNIETGYDAILELGRAVGRESEARQLAESLKTEINAALTAAPGTTVRVYHELDENYFSVSSFSFIGAVYAALGATNIADPADPEGYGYPQLTEEYIVEANPELIVITDQVNYDAESVATRPGWENISAVQNGHISVVDADIASRWGPRIPQFVSAAAEALTNVVASTP